MTLLPLKTWSARTAVAVFLLAAGLSVCIFHLAYQSQAAGTPDSHANPVANSTEVAITSPAVPAGATYTWNPPVPAIGDWTIPTNWTPTRFLPASNDVLVINTGFTPTLTNVPNQTIGVLLVSSNTSAKLQAGADGNTLTISGATGSDLQIDSGSSITLDGSNALKISVASGSTGLISGSAIFQGGAHRLIGNASGAITFASASFFTTTTGFTGNPFGTGTDGSVAFLGGSSSFFNAGGDPFGGPGHSIATFNLGSSQTFTTAAAFLSDGRTYGNLTLDGSQSYAGSGTGFLTVFNTLTIASGSTLTLSSSSGGDLNLLGDITVNGSFNANGRTVKFQGGGLFGGDTQNINTAATFGDVIISKIAGSVKLGGALTINGALQFNGSSSAVDVVDLNADRKST